ncbi:MAG: dihydroorotase [Alphaproteobacteria bacterium]|nr:dihydroorotase [Alphaproteobacteria bacterium]
MTTILIKDGHVIDPANGIDRSLDVLVENRTIAEVRENIGARADEVIDARGLIVSPGLIDLQVHVREPGREDRETIETASHAALAGGITSIVAMPNTSPVADSQSVIEFVVNRAKQLDLVNVYPAGAITKGQKGETLAEINEMKRSGAIAITDDGVDVQNEVLLRRAMEYARTCDILLMSHCETDTLTDGGVMHEGWMSTQLGLAGTPAISEDLAVRKNIMLAILTGARLHLLHNSTAGAVEAIREAKRAGHKNITAEVSVQHFSLTDEECAGYNTNAKMYPPLRSSDHLEAIIEGIRADVFDAFTTDHAPHIEPDKLEPFARAAFGSTGLETSFAVMHTYLVKAGHISLAKGLSKMTCEPARILGIDKGTLSPGADADIALFDAGQTWVPDSRKHSFSKGKNCVFNGKPLTGKAVCTISGGRIRYRDGKVSG